VAQHSAAVLDHLPSVPKPGKRLRRDMPKQLLRLTVAQVSVALDINRKGLPRRETFRLRLPSMNETTRRKKQEVAISCCVPERLEAID
jgi:hypothetical protein